MKLKIVTDQGKKINIPIPNWLIRMGINKSIQKAYSSQKDNQESNALSKFDLSIIADNIEELSNYKGLVVLHAVEKDGTEVKLIV
ncbi:hypothetical protein [Oceanirhabdus sp. W0125-5]|uniref:hypothetical protein n=1 Tax=Oceanirhabdus sp. W0125-5 TaxID=2999116 RepID=UPI0022F2CE94|nr:hypothetical protein [Oceanirhabdus sp. W0125-5]WBW95159.1 hypothetical protein OW730_15860 [Oceanirhabdus sp. W0125-5]